MQSQGALSLKLVTMKTMSKTRKMEASNSRWPVTQETLRDPQRLSARSTLDDLPAEIYCGLIWRYTAKLAGMATRKALTEWAEVRDITRGSLFLATPAQRDIPPMGWQYTQ
jgi:hypothetical protein